MEKEQEIQRLKESEKALKESEEALKKSEEALKESEKALKESEQTLKESQRNLIEEVKQKFDIKIGAKKLTLESVYIRMKRRFLHFLQN